MFFNLASGASIIGLTVLVHTFGLILITNMTAAGVARLRYHSHSSRVASMIVVVIALFGLISIEVWMWAFFYYQLGFVETFETALYFSTVTFSTIGYGDIVPDERWRLLAALEGINGFLLIGWSTAYLVAAGIRIGPFRPGEHF